MDFSLDGLASGMPTEQILSQMRYIEEQPIRSLEDDISQVEQEKNAWRDVNSRMSKLDNLIGDLQDVETYTSNTTSSSDENVVTASASTEAIEGSYNITVNQKAQSQRVVGASRLAEAISSASTNATVADSEIAMKNGESYTVKSISATDVDGFGSDETGTVKTFNYALVDNNNKVVAVSENGESYKALTSATTNDFDSANLETELQGLTNEGDVGSDYAFGFQVSTGTSLEMRGTDGDELNTLTDASIGFADDSDPIINGATIDLSSDDTISDVVNKINDSNAGVTASMVDSYLVLESKETGVNNNITLNENGGSLLTDLGVYDSNESDNVYKGGTDGSGSGYYAAQDAKITVNGISDITSSNNTFDDVVEGVTFNISSASETDDTATIDVSADTGKAYDAIKAVVDQYNSVMDFMDKKTAKDKVLQGDGTANRIASNLRMTLIETVETGNDINYMSELGLEFDEADYNKLTIDKSKLEEMVTEQSDKVYEFFAPDKSEDADYDHDGLATKLRDYTSAMVESDGIIPGREEMLNNQIENMEESISDYEERVSMRMETMKSQFTQMEKTLSNLNNQGSWMQSQISSMGLSGGLTSMMG